MLKKDGVDLSRLNEAERQVLYLLAEGHTAKSVANELGSTPAAVNERLREARRKTGVGSSRELARRLKSQENRHNEIVVGSSSVSAFQLLPGREHGALGNWKGPILMSVGLLAVIGSAAALLGSTEHPSTNVRVLDPLYGDVLVERDPSEMFKDARTEEAVRNVLMGEGSASLFRRRYAQVRSEVRDPDWASATEAGLKAAFSTVPHVGVNGTELRTKCAATLCEVIGTIDTSFGKDEAAIIEEVNRSTAPRLNPHAMQTLFAKLKLKTAGWVQSSTKEQPPRPMFLAYFTREE
ncbi:MAG TPA: helix-turn-helix transcriptional regulator [Sphingomicrobium sp.]|nr:helix-turn-helix transcriptional regulator [Sphingomicrobium sp.]